MKRFSRSDFVDDRSDEFCLSLIVERTGKVPQSPGGAEDCRQWRLEIVRNRGEERLPEPIGLGGELGALDVLDEVHAVNRERSVVRECIKQPALLRAEERAGLVAVDPDYAHGASPRPHGQEQPLRTWQSVGAASGGRLCSQVHFAAAISASSNMSSGG